LTDPGRAGIYGRMDGRSATLAALGVAIGGIVAFILLDGVTAGLVLFVAGVLLVVIGIFGWQDRAPALATASGVSGAVLDERTADDPVQRTTEPVDAGGSLVGEEVPAPHPAIGLAEAAADPLGRADSDSVLDADGTTEADGTDPAGPAGSDQPAPAPMMRLVQDADDLDHVHDQPLLGHSDLVAHAGDYHREIATDGSTIQLRLLHERAHGAPHETPPTLRPR
jgi:hypothetical protein